MKERMNGEVTRCSICIKVVAYTQSPYSRMHENPSMIMQQEKVEATHTRNGMRG